MRSLPSATRAAALLTAVAAVLSLPAGGAASTETASVRNGEIAFVRDPNFYGRGGLFTVKPDGTGLRRVLKSWGVTHAAWSPNGTQLAIADYCEIRVLTPRGKLIRRVTKKSGPWCDVEPSWSPDGKRLVFVRSPNLYTMPAGSIYVVNANGRGLRRLTRPNEADAFDLEPDWSPDGTRILFAHSDSSAPDPPYSNWANSKWLYVVNPDGSGLARFSPLAPTRAPDWSPDGARIAFTGGLFTTLPPNAVWTGQIGVMTADGGNVQILVSEDQGEGRSCSGHGGWNVVWSPDGSKLAYSGPCPQGVYVMSPDGSHKVRVTRGSGDTVLDWRARP